MRCRHVLTVVEPALYLDGLVSEESLLIGKFASKHIGIMRELRLRNVLGPPRLTPLYPTLPGAAEGLSKIRRVEHRRAGGTTNG